MGEIHQKSQKYITAIDADEVACRFLEAFQGVKRPLGASAQQAIDGLFDSERIAARKAAAAVMDYWRECIAELQTEQ